MTREEIGWLRHVASMVRAGSVPTMGRWNPWQKDQVADLILGLTGHPVPEPEKTPSPRVTIRPGDEPGMWRQNGGGCKDDFCNFPKCDCGW